MLTDKQCEVINALAFSGMRINKAAEKIGCGESTVRRHVAQIKEQTGLNPQDFFDLHDLYEIAGGAENDHRQST